VSADAKLLRERVEQRKNHYMPASLLDSQLATLEPLQPDEPGVTVSAAGSPDAVVDELLADIPPAG
jgi:gluconokinase